MVTGRAKKKGCCTSSMNLPEEMEAAVRHHGGMEKIKSIIPSKESFATESSVLNALSDPIRLQILSALNTLDLCPCLLKEITELSDSKLSYHLNILEVAGIITSSPKRRWRVYMLTDFGRDLLSVERTLWPREASSEE